MQHEEFVETAMLDAARLAADMAVFDVDLRRLREAGELLMRRLRRDDPRRVRAEIFEAHRKTPRIERVEFHETGPGLVEEDVVAKLADPLDDHVGAEDRAVIGALFDDADAERPLASPGLLMFDQRRSADRLANRFFVKEAAIDRADQPMRVAVSRQEDRNAAAEEQGAMMRRLVIVAIKQHEIVLGDEGGKHDLVGGRGAVENEVGLLGAENRRGLFLRLQGGTFMREEIAELENRIVEIVAKHRLAEMLHENAADRTT